MSGSGDGGDDDAALALAGVALGLVLIISVVFFLVFCLFCLSTRRQLVLLRSQVDRLTRLENGKIGGENVTELREYDKEPTRLSAPPEDNPPPVEPTSRYRRVNVSGILPEVVRTPDNLEGEDIPIDRAQALLEQHRKQEEKRYEETELKRLRSETPEDTKSDDDAYNDPADVVARSSLFREGRVSSSGEASRKFQIGSSPKPGVEEYTEVFDRLPIGEVERVSGPNFKLGGQVLSTSPPPNGMNGYEDVTSEECLKPGSLPAGSMEFLADDDTRRFSMPAGKRQSAGKDKEEVKYDPTAKKFLSESQRKKKRNMNSNNHNGQWKRSPEKPARKMPSFEDESPLKPKEARFEMTDGFPQESYAEVNLTDKQKYRAEEDGLKREGSGVPLHYTAKQKLENESSTL